MLMIGLAIPDAYGIQKSIEPYLKKSSQESINTGYWCEGSSKALVFIRRTWVYTFSLFQIVVKTNVLNISEITDTLLVRIL